ncbi:hypothetical protein [Actinophytocola sp.]|uniref:hypothetical protein n=1 Tax=Actinophytocola sp. TaxID=1872138 RepID=UPI002ED31DDE
MSGGSAKDPEKLLAEALRAQATRAPADTSPVGYGLVSSDLPALRHSAPKTEVTRQIVLPQLAPRQVPAALILLLALLLGLASGAVVGLLTLI